MCFVPQFTEATGIGLITLESVITQNEILRIHAESGKGYDYKRAKEYANKVKQCCEVCIKPACRKHSHKTSGLTCSNHCDTLGIQGVDTTPLVYRLLHIYYCNFHRK